MHIFPEAVVYFTACATFLIVGCMFFHAQVVSTDGATASMVANNCTSNQTPTTLAQSHDGTDIGALLTMTATGIVKPSLQNN